MRTVSVIIPTLNEEQELPMTLAHLQPLRQWRDCFVVDAGSTDDTRALAASAGCTVLEGPRGRGHQLRLGAAAATGDVLLFLHADTWLPNNAFPAIQRALDLPNVIAGGFWKVFRNPHWLMRGSRWRCWTRLHFFGRLAADQAIFVRRDALEQIGGVPAVPLMEEFELCRALRKIGRLALADATVSTSARRWHERGVLRTYARMAQVTTLYYLGWSPEKLAELYQRKRPR